MKLFRERLLQKLDQSARPNFSMRARGILCTMLVSLSASQAFVPTLLGQGLSPEESVERMTVADGFAVELAAAEPLVRQPVAIDFDDRGRMWALQYLQYPNPAGLKRVRVDRYSRTTYDRVPKPPPLGPKGADRLTILMDTDGDGRADSSKDFLKDLNLATGFQFGYGGAFVLQAPYLLFYPDRNRDDIPDGDPDVLLTGFGMQDTSSLANSLTWGPDGWLYGTQGTNLTADIRGIPFEQGVWRYHPVSGKFELFIEGGSNMWGLDFDRHGNLFAGTNYGGFLMFHCVQGAYYQKSFAKHGALSNPFAFGYFEHVPHEGFQGGHVTVGGILYQADAFPSRFRDKYIAVDTLGHAVRWHHVTPHDSSFRSQNGGVLLQANDSWFAPSDCVVGPDGALYVADWHDKRTAHPDPDAAWDRTNGRVFRVRWKAATTPTHTDPQTLSNNQLTTWLRSANAWRVRRARRVLAERQATDIAADLRGALHAAEPQLALEFLWTLEAMGESDERLATTLLSHGDANIRSWSIRLLGDRGEVSEEAARQLNSLASSDEDSRVISQLAATANRLPAKASIPLARSLAERSDYQWDPHVPLLAWWAVERHAISATDQVLEAFANPASWQSPIVRDVILGRLMRRLAGDGSESALTACARLINAAPSESQRRRMIMELDNGLKMLGRIELPRLPLPENRLAVRQQPAEPPESNILQAAPPALAQVVRDLWRPQTTDPLTIRVSARCGNQAAISRAAALATDSTVEIRVRLEMLAILHELGDARACVATALKLLQEPGVDEIQLAALNLSRRFADGRITALLLNRYPTMREPMRTRAGDVLLERPESALRFLGKIDRGAYSANEVSVDQLRRVALHNNDEIDAIVRRHWGNIRAGTPEEKLAELRRINNDLRAGNGNARAGHGVFEKRCATCHTLFGQGKAIGPDLTKANRGDRDFLLVSMVDPSAQIRKEYLSFVAVTLDGRVVTGLLAEETDAAVSIVGAKGERTTIARNDIQRFQASSASLMPENILKELQPQQVRDLMAYLQSDVAPRADTSSRKSKERP